MSQNRNTMRMIEKRSGMEGLILRPLCAKLLSPTIPEEKGWVDREKLLDISGRGRGRQMELAAKYGITEYPSPAGGCLLTDPGFCRRLRDLLENEGDVGSADVTLLKVGRQFRVSGGARVVIGRTHADNQAILSMARPGDRLLRNADVPGPVTLLRGEATDDGLAQAAALTARYGQARAEAQVAVNCRKVDEHGEQDDAALLTVAPSDPEELGVQRIG